MRSTVEIAPENAHQYLGSADVFGGGIGPRSRSLHSWTVTANLHACAARLRHGTTSADAAYLKGLVATPGVHDVPSLGPLYERVQDADEVASCFGEPVPDLDRYGWDDFSRDESAGF